MPVSRLIILLISVFFMFCSSQKDGDVNISSPEQSMPVDTSRTATTPGDRNLNRLYVSTGQLLYVPVYSHIYQRNQQRNFNLTATLSFRNADPNRSLTLTKVMYYDSQGEPVKDYLDSSREIAPLASTSFVVEENDLRGGVGANFIVEWKAEQEIYPPVVEAVMISTTQQQGISFVSAGRVLQEKQ